jgi:hypothetical protein
LFYYDWTQGWESSKPYTAPAVVIYFILNAAFTYWIWGIEKGTIFVGYAKSGEKVRFTLLMVSEALGSLVRLLFDFLQRTKNKLGCVSNMVVCSQIRISSHTKKHTPVYELKVTVTGKGSKAQSLEISAPFSNWFTSDGYFIAKPFQQWLASNVSVIGAADPNNIVEEIGRGSGASTGAGTGTEGKAGGARSRRKG